MTRVLVDGRSVEVSLWHLICGAGSWIDAQVVGGTLHVMRKRVGVDGAPALCDSMTDAERAAVLGFVSWWFVVGESVGDELGGPPGEWLEGPAPWEFEDAQRVS